MRLLAKLPVSNIPHFVADPIHTAKAPISSLAQIIKIEVITVIIEVIRRVETL